MRFRAAPWRCSKQPLATAGVAAVATAGAAARGGGANTIQAKLTYAAPTTSAIVDPVPASACISHAVVGSATITGLSDGRVLMLMDIGRSAADVEPPTSTLD
jgi:hypothetical protein